MSRPSDLAVLPLITSWNFVGCIVRSGIFIAVCFAWVFKLHGDEVGRAHSVAGCDSVKGLVQCLCRLPIPNRRNESLGGPARGDLIGQNADAVAGLPRTRIAAERYRA